MDLWAFNGRENFEFQQLLVAALSAAELKELNVASCNFLVQVFSP